MKQNKTIRIIINLLIYLVGIIGSYFLYQLFESILPQNLNNPLFILIIINVILTIFIFTLGTIIKEYNLYNLYWGVVSLFSILMFALKTKLLSNGNVIIIIICIAIYTLKSLAEFIIKITNNENDDWKYETLQKKHPSIWPIFAFFLMSLLPTALLYLGMLPAFKYIEEFKRGATPTLSTWLGLVVLLVGIVFEEIAEIQKSIFNKKQDNKGKICNYGLYKKSRYPQYFGEILFWFGLCMMGISFVNDQNWILISSPVMILVYISALIIPMNDKHNLEVYHDFDKHKEKTNGFFPF